MGEEGAGEGFAVAALREARDAQGRLSEVRFVYRGRDVAAALDPARREWRVQVGGRPVGALDAVAGEQAHTVARAIVGVYLRG
jgi:hypothetical protein